jgi:preprotein translocase subunit SecG
MLIGLLTTLFVLVCFLLILLVLIQQGKGSMGIGSIGGGAQMLFGGSGGQDLFQKITWVLCALFMGGSLCIGLLKINPQYTSSYMSQLPSQEQPYIPQSTVPADLPTEE